MGKLNCICGNQISDVMFPNEHVGLIVSSQSEDEFEDCSSLTMNDLESCGRDIWECPKCGRLAVNYPDINSNTVKWYKPEDGEIGHILKYKQ